MAPVREQLIWHSGPVAEPSFVPGAAQNKQFFGPHGKWSRVTHTGVEYIVSEVHRGPVAIVPLFTCRKSQRPKLTFHFEISKGRGMPGWLSRLDIFLQLRS